MFPVKNNFQNCIESSKYLIKTFKRIYPLIKKFSSEDKIRLFSGLALITLSIYLNMLMPMLYSRFHEILSMLEDNNKRNNMDEVFKLLIFFTLAGNSINILRNLTDIISSPISKKLANVLTLDFLSKINVGTYEIFDEHAAGEVLEKISRARSSIATLSTLFVHGTPSVIDFLIALTSFAYHGNSFLFLNLILYFLAYSVFIYLSSISLNFFDKNERLAAEALSNHLGDVLAQIDSFNIFIDREIYLDKCKFVLDYSESTSNLKNKWSNQYSILQVTISILNFLFFRGIVLWGVIKNLYPIAQYRALDYLFSQITYPLDSLYNYFKIGRFIANDLNNYYDLLEETKLLYHVDAPLNLSRGEITFLNVSFFRKNHKIIDYASFTIQPKKITGIVGYNGSGKTNLIKLLLRIFEPDSGEIMIDQQNINKVSLSSLRKHISIAPQKPAIFNENLTFNITCGSIFSKQVVIDMIQKCKLNCLLEINSDPDQIMLGKNGISLSGGQEQLLSLARLMLKNPDIVIYDEAFSQIDNQTLHHLLPIISEFNQQKTVIFIDHHLENIKHAHHIIVLNQGKVVEQGTHDELLTIVNGDYYHLWNSEKLAQHFTFFKDNVENIVQVHQPLAYNQATTLLSIKNPSGDSGMCTK